MKQKTMINNVTIIGRFVRDHEIRTIGSTDTKVIKNAIAVDRAGARDEENQLKAGFFDVEIWDKQAEIAEKYTQKGSKVGLEGSLKQDTWEKDGVKGSRVIVKVRNIELLDPKGTKEDSEPVAATAATAEEDPFK